MIVNLLTEHHLEFLSLKRGCRGTSESTHVAMPHCWKSHATAQMRIFDLYMYEVPLDPHRFVTVSEDTSLLYFQPWQTTGPRHAKDTHSMSASEVSDGRYENLTLKGDGNPDDYYILYERS